MRIKPEFRVDDIDIARSIIREHPFATLITGDLCATHMPCLVDEEADELTVLGHVARADPVAERLGGRLLAIFQGPHGYVSANWYDDETIPTWNHLTLHVRGSPAVLDDALPLLRRTVDHFEAALPRPWSLQRMGETARAMADEVLAFRLVAEQWHAEAKLSQDKSAQERARVRGGLEASGPYANLALARLMRRFGP